MGALSRRKLSMHVRLTVMMGALLLSGCEKADPADAAGALGGVAPKVSPQKPVSGTVDHKIELDHKVDHKVDLKVEFDPKASRPRMKGADLAKPSTTKPLVGEDGSKPLIGEDGSQPLIGEDGSKAIIGEEGSQALIGEDAALPTK